MRSYPPIPSHKQISPSFTLGQILGTQVEHSHVGFFVLFFFMYFARILHKCPLHQFLIVSVPLWNLMKQKSCLCFSQFSFLPGSHQHGLLNSAGSILIHSIVCTSPLSFTWTLEYKFLGGKSLFSRIHSALYRLLNSLSEFGHIFYSVHFYFIEQLRGVSIRSLKVW